MDVLKLFTRDRWNEMGTIMALNLQKDIDEKLLKEFIQVDKVMLMLMDVLQRQGIIQKIGLT